MKKGLGLASFEISGIKMSPISGTNVAVYHSPDPQFANAEKEPDVKIKKIRKIDAYALSRFHGV